MVTGEKGKMKNIKKIIRIILYTMFIIYCLVVINIVFMRGSRDGYGVLEYIKSTSNFIPFKTIIKFIRAIPSGFVTLAFANIVGNFLLFLPMGMLLPCVFTRLNKFWKILLTILTMIWCVELLQGFLRVGIMDIDDVILNMSGAMIGYGIIRIPPINKLLTASAIINKELTVAKKKLWLLLCPCIAFAGELLPYGAVMNFANPEGESWRRTFSYFDTTPFGYANFGPFITAVLTVLIITLVAIYFVFEWRGLYWTIAVITGLSAVSSLIPLLYGISYFTFIGGIISAALLTHLSVMVFARKTLERKTENEG